MDKRYSTFKEKYVLITIFNKWNKYLYKIT